jgi:hypothetical protein
VRLGAPLPQYALPGTTIGAWVQRSEGSSAAYPVREETTNSSDASNEPSSWRGDADHAFQSVLEKPLEMRPSFEHSGLVMRNLGRPPFSPPAPKQDDTGA